MMKALINFLLKFYFYYKEELKYHYLFSIYAQFYKTVFHLSYGAKIMIDCIIWKLKFRYDAN